MNSRKWDPLIQVAERQLKVILDALENKASGNIALLSGDTGIALLYYYYWLYSNDDKYLEKGNTIVMNNFQFIHKTDPALHSLCNGTSGFFWAVNHLIENGFIEGDRELFSGNDPFLFSVMEKDLKKGQYDFLHNALGIGLYFLCQNTPESVKYIEWFVSELEKIAEPDRNSLKWRSNYYINEKESKEVYNLSLSHGIASIIAFLDRVHRKGIAKNKSLELLGKAINFLLDHKYERPNTNGSYFPSVVFVHEHNHESGSRLAWCYGDLGIGIILWQASQTMQSSDLERVALEILLQTTIRKDPVKEHVIDAGICHGAAGIAHIYNRMYHYTGMDEFRKAAIFWIEETVRKAYFTDGIAGYKAWHTEKHGGWISSIGLLEGVSGIGLVLLSAISDIEPKWDECLLLS